jgi:anti-sigma regulatory factor (Ser/Thr protein kinase)
VILMTAHGSEATAEAALRIGAASYVPKRKLASDLVETLGAVLQLSHTGRRESSVDPLEAGELVYELGVELETMTDVIGTLESSLVKLGLADDGGALQVGVALREAIVNAVVHGSLEVSSRLLDDGDGAAFHALVAERKKQAPYARRTVRLTALHRTDEVVYTVSDQGPGFDPSTLPDPTDPANLDRTHGRGLMLIRTFMDEVSFHGRGNEIRMTKRRAPKGEA